MARPSSCRRRRRQRSHIVPHGLDLRGHGAAARPSRRVLALHTGLKSWGGTGRVETDLSVALRTKHTFNGRVRVLPSPGGGVGGGTTTSWLLSRPVDWAGGCLMFTRGGLFDEKDGLFPASVYRVPDVVTHQLCDQQNKILVDVRVFFGIRCDHDRQEAQHRALTSSSNPSQLDKERGNNRHKNKPNFNFNDRYVFEYRCLVHGTKNEKCDSQATGVPYSSAGVTTNLTTCFSWGSRQQRSFPRALRHTERGTVVYLVS